ncbi:PQQ-binding-like beta-propeller repeat protein [Blastococcus saxobsidens]|uniref:Putative pyrroloquinoline-quinone binding quinoprotein n=1 Tax=Blastococcus saxobsidens TaxID=138336 RepID=A0A4V2G2F8_9ACTN|nr:PQQ-binding-like beta-propeller repeat protein [Blastococcus saxobsidens]RZU32976.1 putative pyrroloquinoline-quinone binding quinoprotein [Blastococcus saxobsidens]
MEDPPSPHPSLRSGRAPEGGPFHHLTSPPPLRVWAWTVAALVLAVVATLLWRGSDAAATHSSTARPADVPPGAPAGVVSGAWSADGDLLPADVVEAGRVVVGSTRGIRALDPVSGEEAWRYRRDNAWLCGLTATDGVVVAVFRTEDRCDEAVGLDAGTGVRSWTRNVDFAADASLASTDRIVLAASRGGVVTLDPTGSSTRWRYAAPSGCRLLDAAVGDAGVVVLQRCAGGSAAQLRLLDGFGGEERWTRDVVLDEREEGRLLGADSLVGVLAGDEVRLFTAADGTLLTALPAGPERAVGQTGTAEAVLLHVGGALVAFHPQTAERLWEHPATGLPGAPAEPGEPAPLAVPEDGAVVLRDPATGTELDRFTVDELPDGGTATVVGPVVVLRTDERVLGYR